jgi:hypothetical protein
VQLGLWLSDSQTGHLLLYGVDVLIGDIPVAVDLRLSGHLLLGHLARERLGLGLLRRGDLHGASLRLGRLSADRAL